MERAEHLLCGLLRTALSGGEAEAEDFTPEEWEQARELAEKNGVGALVFEGLAGWNPPAAVQEKLQKSAYETAVRFYQMAQFTNKILALFQKEQIPAVVLKGMGLNALYPKEESRKLSDLDLYVADGGAYERACTLLEAQGYLHPHDHSGYHQEFRCMEPQLKRSFVLELHSKITYRFKQADVDSRVDAIFEKTEIRLSQEQSFGLKIPVLEETRNAFYLLLHMLSHFVTAGFSLRNLCDWTVFLRERGARIEPERFLSYVNSIGAGEFAKTVTQACRLFLGLEPSACPWLEPGDEEIAEALMEDLISGGEFGNYDTTRVWFAVGSTEQPGFREYFRQLRRETRQRYPRLSGVPVLHPFLWARIGVGFLLNNRRERNSSLGDVLETFSRRSKLSASLHLFETSGKGKKR